MSSDDELLKCVFGCFEPTAKKLGCSSTDLHCFCVTDADPVDGINTGLCIQSKCGGLSTYSRLQEICAKEKAGSGGGTSSGQSSTVPSATQRSASSTDDGTSAATSKPSVSESSKPSDISKSESSNSSSANSKGGLSAGAAAGIGVGAAIAVMLLLIGMFLLWRKKRKQQRQNPESPSVDEKTELSGQPVYKAEMQGDEYRPELQGQYTHTPASSAPSNQVKELQGSGAVYELPVESQNR